MRVIPAIDLQNGKCVRLLRGDFDRTTEYSANPVAVGQRFSALAVKDLHIVDLDGARTGMQQNHAIVAAIVAQTGLIVQLGGGIRNRDDVARWLGAGVTRCVVGSVAINSPATALCWLNEFGADAIVLALDVKLSDSAVPMLTTQGWTADSGVSLWQYLDELSGADVRHVLCTDVARDGAMSGPNIELYGELRARYPELALQASGGVRHLADLRALRDLGVSAAITGRALLDGKLSASEVASFQRSV